MDLQDYVRAVRRRWWMVLTALLTAVGIADLGDVLHSYGELVAARSPLAVPGRSGPAYSY